MTEFKYSLVIEKFGNDVGGMILDYISDVKPRNPDTKRNHASYCYHGFYMREYFDTLSACFMDPELNRDCSHVNFDNPRTCYLTKKYRLFRRDIGDYYKLKEFELREEKEEARGEIRVKVLEPDEIDEGVWYTNKVIKEIKEKKRLRYRRPKITYFDYTELGRKQCKCFDEDY